MPDNHAVIDKLLGWLRRPTFPKAEGRVFKRAEIPQISNADLTEEAIPDPDARWDGDQEIGRFAATFNGYQHWGSFKKCAEVANHRGKDLSTLTLTELRTSLFFHFRALHHDDWDVLPSDNKDAQEILAKIRDRVRRGAIE